MAYNEKLADRIRERLADLPKVEEKKMMGGLCFMYRDKMCVGIMKDELMCRINPELQEEYMQKKGCRTMTMGKKEMSGWVLVDEEGMKSTKDFNYWIEEALAFNKDAKSSKKKK